MKKFLRFLLLLGLLLCLMACSSSVDVAEDQTGLVLPAETYSFYDTSDFSIQYPVNWKILPKQQISEKFQETAEVAFISNFKDLFFTPVVVIEKVSFDTQKNQEDFANESLSQYKSSMSKFDEIERQSISLVSGTNAVISRLIRFTGKSRLQDDTLEYLQTYLASGDSGYIVTAVYDPTDDNNESDKLVNVLRTFKIK